MEQDIKFHDYKSLKDFNFFSIDSLFHNRIYRYFFEIQLQKIISEIQVLVMMILILSFSKWLDLSKEKNGCGMKNLQFLLHQLNNKKKVPNQII